MDPVQTNKLSIQNQNAMRKFHLFLVFCITLHSAFSQTVSENYPKTLWCPNDTFLLKFPGSQNVYTYKVSRTDKSSPGTDARPDGYAVIYYGNDSLVLKYHNKLPYAHIIFINFESPKGKTTLRFHFNDVASYFDKEYIQKNKNNIQFDIPESYELANIIWTLSPAGQKATDLYKQSDYYKKVFTYFSPFLHHPIFSNLSFPDSLYYQKYYEFRENSFAFNFKDPEPGSVVPTLLFNGPYYFVFGEDLADSTLFGKLKPMVEDFAATSEFRKFYYDNLSFYQKAIEREKELLPVRRMWQWLEEQFPAKKYQSYRVVFSPLIGGSHSTQRYSSPDSKGWFSENVMFICGADRYDSIKGLSEKQKEGLMSGIVFTEIDHNYVNPVSSQYKAAIDSAFADRKYWVKKGIASDGYGSTMSVFNEYMTHAAFCLYIKDSYEKSIADFVIEDRESLMVNRRGFIRFKEFDRELLRLYTTEKSIKTADLYPLILKWCKEQY